MKLEFDLGNVTVTEFGVGRDEGNGQSFVAVPVDLMASHKSALDTARGPW